MIYQSYELNMIPRYVKPIVSVSQFDDGGRTISFILKNGESDYTPVNPAVFIGETEVACTVSDNVVSFVVDASLTQEGGIYLGEVRDTDGGILGSSNFDFQVDRTPLPSEDVINSLSFGMSPLSLRPNLSHNLQPLDIAEDPVEEDPIEEEDNG